MEEARTVAEQPSATNTTTGGGDDGAPAAPALTPATTSQGTPTGAPPVPPGPGSGDYQPPVGKWKDHMFNCFSQTSPSCLVSCFLPCFALAMISKRVGYANYNMVFWILLALAILGNFFGPVIFYALAVLTITIQLLLIIRAKFQLPALIGKKKKDGCLAITADVLAVCFCTPCVISQMMRHTFNYTRQCDECNITEDRVATLV